MSNPLVSIITPSLNQGKYIEDLISCIKRQAYRNYEHIIIDGGSNDGTLDILKKHESSYNMIWHSEPDPGMYYAVNKGLKLAKGQILAYLNCDDLYFPWTLSVIVKNMEFTDFVFGDVVRCDENYNSAWLQFFPPFHEEFYQNVGIIAQPTVFFSRRIYEHLGGFDAARYKYIADCDYWLKSAAAGFRPQKIYEFLAVQRDHSEALSARNISKVRDELASLRRQYGNTPTIKMALQRLRRPARL